MEVNTNSIVGIEYILYNNGTGEILEETPNDKLMKFKFGIGELLPLFEANIIGLKANDTFNFRVPAPDAFGPVDPYAIFDIPMDTFENDGKIDDFGRLLDSAWYLKKKLSNSITNKKIDQLYELLLKNGATGGKLLGAGGGHARH